MKFFPGACGSNADDCSAFCTGVWNRLPAEGRPYRLAAITPRRASGARAFACPALTCTWPSCTAAVTLAPVAGERTAAEVVLRRRMDRLQLYRPERQFRSIKRTSDS